MEVVLALFAAFGFGSVVTALVQAWLNNSARSKERSFKERQEAYVGLLEAYHRAAVAGTVEAGKAFAYWQMRCELVAPEPVRIAIQSIIDTDNDSEGRGKAHEELKNAMRSNLKIAR